MGLLHKYKLVEKIQANSRYCVYRGFCQSEQNSVSIKRINPQSMGTEAKAWLNNEYQILNNLNLTGAIQPLSLEQDKDSMALILEDFTGQSLAQFLKSRLTLERFLAIAIRLADILQELSQNQIIHRNIQPKSILINPETLEVKLTDFSLAIEFARQAKITPKLLKGLNIAYISPEQTGRSNIPLDYRTDFYSLGIVLYQMLIGKLPYNTKDALELIHCHLAKTPVAPHCLNQDLPETVAAIVMKLIAKNPEDRYQSGRAVKQDLIECQTQYLERGEIEPFELGSLDRRSQFTIPHKLYGRSTEVEAIASSFARVASGTTELVLVKGDLGIGKTSLVNEAARSIVGQKGYFAVGTFEHLTSGVPYKAIIQAFRGLIQQLLTETEASRQVWQSKILSAVGNNGRVISDILPELELILGSQPEVPQLPPKETQNRFNTVLVKFAQIFARPESPLVLFFDDLQWADPASLNSIALLQSDSNSKYLLIIGTYCDSEVNAEHPLVETIERISQTLQVNRFELQPLTLDEVNRLLIDTLNCPESESLPLAQLLIERTHGNPFFINQLLQTIHTEKLLTFNFDRLSWQWCTEEILATSVTNYDVLELVCRNIEKLPDTCQQVLKLAACIGYQFDATVLTHIWNTVPKSSSNSVSDLGQNKIKQELNYALQAGIVIAERRSSSSYQFLHNRVHKAVYSLLSEAETAQIHLRIGQFLFQQTSPTELEEKIFTLVHHLNIGKKLLTHSTWQIRLAQLNLIAAKKAKDTTAYEVAADRLDIAIELLSSSSWKDNYELMFDLYLEATEVQYLQTNFIRAEQLGNLILTQVETVLDKVRVYKIKIHAYIAQNQMQLAVDTGLYVLQLLGISLPDSPNYNLVNNLSLESLKTLPEMSDRSSLAAIDMIQSIIPPIYITQPQLFPVVVTKMVDLCLQDGNSRFSSFAYSVYGLLLCASGNIDTGYQMGKLALILQQRFDAKENKSKVDFIFNNMIRHWQEPASSTLEHFLAGVKSGIEVGDLEHACFHATRYCAHLFYVGESLSVADEKSLKQIETIDYFKQDFQLNYARMWRQLNLNLQGLAENKFLLVGDSFDESKILALWLETNDAMSLFAFYLIKLILCYFFKDYHQAIANARQGQQYLPAALGLMGFAVYHFYYSLAMLAVCDDSETKSTYLPEILTYRQQMKQWAHHAPDNYLHKYQLITAEIAKVSEEYDRAAEYYDLAITEAAKAGYLHEAALAEELTGEFYLSRGRTKIAGFYLTDAYHKYRKWGAVAKVQDLDSRYSTLLIQNPTLELATDSLDETEEILVNDYESDSNLATLDLFSVVKASQAISSEIILDNLLSKMMEIVMENAGAQKSILLLQQNSAWVVAASATIAAPKKVSLSHVAIAEYEDLPKSMIRYIQTTRNTVILDRASEEGMFINDPYIIERQPKSILACPTIYQDELQGIIYLENSLVKGAFTSHKLEVLKVLLSQVSISIENARLYKNLENHASVQKSLKQKEILLKEIHHRVKNNLFVVSSLLDFQSNYIEDPEIIKLLENCQNRITSMALVHQHLYGNSELNKINFAQYIESLLDNLAYSQGSRERNINLILDLEPIELNIESANPCGLIVNELVSNSLEHGFVGRDRGNIWLNLKRNLENRIILTIQDDGVGFGDDMDLYNSDSLGLELVCTLVEQIDGEISLDKTNGTKIEIVFDELEYRSRI